MTCSPKCGFVAHLVRALHWYCRCHWFEPTEPWIVFIFYSAISQSSYRMNSFSLILLFNSFQKLMIALNFYFLGLINKVKKITFSLMFSLRFWCTLLILVAIIIPTVWCKFVPTTELTTITQYSSFDSSQMNICNFIDWFKNDQLHHKNLCLTKTNHFILNFGTSKGSHEQNNESNVVIVKIFLYCEICNSWRV